MMYTSRMCVTPLIYALGLLRLFLHPRAAEDAQAEARERLRKGLERIKRNQDRGAAVIEAQNESRRQAVLSLKLSMTAVREEVAKKAKRYRQLQKQKKEVQEKEFQDLLEQGLNPYEVYRKKDVDREVSLKL